MALGLIYLVLIATAELLTSAISAGIGMVSVGIILHSMILFALILQGAIVRQTSRRRLLLVLALAPLIRILSVSLPLKNLPIVDWYLLIGSLLFLGGFIAAKMTGITFQRMGFTWRGWPGQLAIAMIGIALGMTEYFILRPKPLLANFEWGEFLYAAFTLLIFTGLLEEFIFRGLVQEAAIGIMGRSGILYGAVLFAVLHVGYLSIVDVVFVFAVGILFGVIVQRTRSLLGVTLAHGLTNITMYLIFPFILGGVTQPQIVSRQGYQEVLAPRDMVPILPVGTHFPGRLVTATFDPRSASLTPPLAPTWTQTLTFFASPTPAPPTVENFINCSSPPAGWVAYIVQPGDTLFRIGQSRAVSVAQLRSINCLSTSVLLRGQRLYVPNVVGQSMSPPSAAQTEESTLPSGSPTEAATADLQLGDTPDPGQAP